MATPRRFLHVANGTCTTGLIEAAAIPGARSIWADVLYEGPVPAGLTDDELIEIRARFLVPAGHQVTDVADDLRGWRRVIAADSAYDEVILWFEHDLFDQLNLIQVLTWIRGRLSAATRTSLISIGSFPGHPQFKGLGELAPRELATLMGLRQPVSDAQYTLAERAWQAFRAPTPEPLDALRHSNTAALPFLEPAITRFLEEYPWAADGLSRSERRLLRQAESRPLKLSTAFPRMHEGEEAYYITDGSLAELADALSTASPSLLALARDPDDAGLLSATVTLTDSGRAVLNGRQDRIALCGIDRWLGGVHLQGDTWRWDDARRRIVKS